MTYQLSAITTTQKCGDEITFFRSYTAACAVLTLYCSFESNEETTVMREIAIALVMMISVSSAQAFVYGDSTNVTKNSYMNLVEASTQTEAGYVQIHATKNIITVNTISNRVIEVVTELDSQEVMEIKVISLKGETVYEGKTTGYFSLINLDEMIEAGVYMIQVNAGQVQQTKRLVIQ